MKLSDLKYQLSKGLYDKTIMFEDKKGVPIVDYGYRWGIYIGKQRNPITIAQKIINEGDKYKKNKIENHKINVINCADWLVENIINKKKYSVWEYKFNFNYGFKGTQIKAPFISGMAQGQCIHALIYAYKITKNKKYNDCAKKALQSFFYTVKEGGVVFKDYPNSWWFEEYCAPFSSRVLNGHIFAILGIYEYQKLNKDKTSEELLMKGLNALNKNILKYDTGKWTKYDLIGTIASKSYHQIHINQMKEIYDITKNKKYLELHTKWKKYNKNYKYVKLILLYYKIKILICSIIKKFNLHKK